MRFLLKVSGIISILFLFYATIPATPSTSISSSRSKITKALASLNDKMDTYLMQNTCANLNQDVTYSRNWDNPTHNHQYAANLSVSANLYCQAKTNREKMPEPNTSSNEAYWSVVYKNLVRFDSQRMTGLITVFEKVGKEQGLNYAEFADMVVSFIQTLPYVLICNETVDKAIASGDYRAEYLLNNRGPYITNIRFGLLSPLEYLYTQKGDCDTRTVLAYTILSKFGYDVVVVNNHSHSILGINLPANGNWVVLGSTKYTLWETTNVWQMGQLSPEHQYNYWYEMLPSSNKR